MKDDNMEEKGNDDPNKRVLGILKRFDLISYIKRLIINNFLIISDN